MARFLQSLGDGQLLRHTLTTLSEVLAGLLLVVLPPPSWAIFWRNLHPGKTTLALPGGQPIHPDRRHCPAAGDLVRSGYFLKDPVCSLIVFFPILINTVVGLREVPQDLRDLMRTLKATPFQTFWKLEVPAALPIYLGGLRVGATLSVIGAVVGELVGADRGLGFLINVGRGQYDTAWCLWLFSP
jgi:NitT/TauT family transport system permease protein